MTSLEEASSLRIWMVLLGGGLSKRMGKPKQLLPLRTGIPMIVQTAQMALQARESSVQREDRRLSIEIAIIVNGAEPQISQALSGLPLTVVPNHAPERGLSSSLHLGISLAKRKKADAVLLMLCDQPDVNPEVISNLLAKFQTVYVQEPLLMQPLYRKRAGHPILFSHHFFEELLGVKGDQGAREVLKRYQDQIFHLPLEVPYPEDLDTPEEYEAYLQTCNLL